MSDRELLERAAKAAGIVVVRSRLDDPLTGDFLIQANRETPSHAALIGWNPLRDDGDALRLAVDLAIYPTQVGLTVEVFLNRPPAINAWHHVEPHRGDPYAATRRAIVRAAAAIGERMP